MLQVTREPGTMGDAGGCLLHTGSPLGRASGHTGHQRPPLASEARPLRGRSLASHPNLMLRIVRDHVAPGGLLYTVFRTLTSRFVF
jgi:hypothetical protein